MQWNPTATALPDISNLKSLFRSQDSKSSHFKTWSARKLSPSQILSLLSWFETALGGYSVENSHLGRSLISIQSQRCQLPSGLRAARRTTIIRITIVWFASFPFGAWFQTPRSSNFCRGVWLAAGRFPHSKPQRGSRGLGFLPRGTRSTLCCAGRSKNFECHPCSLTVLSWVRVTNACP